MTLDEFWYRLAEWSNRTFGYEHDRGPVAPLRHLAKEVQETLKRPSDLVEYADMLHLLFDACRRAGYSYDDLRHAAAYKLCVNEHRLWPTPTSDEPVEHIREGRCPVTDEPRPADGPAPAAGERFVKPLHGGVYYTVYTPGPDGPEDMGLRLTLADAELLARGRADLARLAAALEKATGLLKGYRAVLRFKEIRPPMDPGAQERLEKEVADFLAMAAAGGGARAQP